MEEMEVENSMGELNDIVEYDYPIFCLLMELFWCEIVKETLKLNEHEDSRWVTKLTLMMWSAA